MNYQIADSKRSASQAKRAVFESTEDSAKIELLKSNVWFFFEDKNFNFKINLYYEGALKYKFGNDNWTIKWRVCRKSITAMGRNLVLQKKKKAEKESKKAAQVEKEKNNNNSTETTI